ncbi:hypothetical protein ACM9HB_34760, partial [Streptomyces sp. JAC128]
MASSSISTARRSVSAAAPRFGSDPVRFGSGLTGPADVSESRFPALVLLGRLTVRFGSGTTGFGCDPLRFGSSLVGFGSGLAGLGDGLSLDDLCLRRGNPIGLRRLLPLLRRLPFQLRCTKVGVGVRLAGFGLLALRPVPAVLRGGRPGPAVLLRGDMDALPVQEDTG